MTIEIEEGVFFDPAKAWYEQSPELVALAEAAMQTAPVDLELEECFGGGTRLKYGVWEHTTPMGTFQMRVDFNWLYAKEHRSFLTRASHDLVTITQL